MDQFVVLLVSDSDAVSQVSESRKEGASTLDLTAQDLSQPLSVKGLDLCATFVISFQLINNHISISFSKGLMAKDVTLYKKIKLDRLRKTIEIILEVFRDATHPSVEIIIEQSAVVAGIVPRIVHHPADGALPCGIESCQYGDAIEIDPRLLDGSEV